MNKIEFAYYEKGNDILLMITGVGGSTKGYANKYERIARQVMDQWNMSVVVATTPSGSWMHAEQNMKEIMSFIHSKRFKKSFKVYALGNSIGANILLWHFNQFPEIEKILAINPVMTVNLHLFCPLASVEKSVNVIFGELDESCKFATMLPASKSVKVNILPKIDHNFTNSLDVFINLPNQYLFNQD